MTRPLSGPRPSRPRPDGDAAWRQLHRDVAGCQQCPRLREYCQDIARQKRKAFRQETYWGRPVPNFGDPAARLLLVGLAPAAHGANRTGRMFTGDRSGEWLFRALHRAGFASHGQSVSAADELRLLDCAITAVCHCAPPENKPTAEELARCGAWLARTLDVVPAVVFLALGQIAWNELCKELSRRGWLNGKRPKFGHGAAAPLSNFRWLLGSYHPSQQNTFTGRLTEKMLDDVLAAAQSILKTSRS